jgi:hypothetical protein
METHNNDNNKSFADILLQAALSATSKQDSQENPKQNSRGILHLLGFCLGFLLYCLFFHLGYSVISTKFSISAMSFLESIQVCLGIFSFGTLLFRRK